jgi:hypothetical protein
MPVSFTPAFCTLEPDRIRTEVISTFQRGVEFVHSLLAGCLVRTLDQHDSFHAINEKASGKVRVTIGVNCCDHLRNPNARACDVPFQFFERELTNGSDTAIRSHHHRSARFAICESNHPDGAEPPNCDKQNCLHQRKVSGDTVAQNQKRDGTRARNRQASNNPGKHCATFVKFGHSDHLKSLQHAGHLEILTVEI